MLRNLSRTAFLALLAAETMACAPGGELQLALVVAGQELGPRGTPAQPGQPPPDIDAFRLCIQRPNGQALHCEDFFELSAGRSYRIGGLPTGLGRTVTFQGYLRSSQEAVWCGRARGVDIRDGSTAQVRMLLTRCGDATQTVGAPVRGRCLHSASLTARGLVFLAGGYERHEASSACGQSCRALVASAHLESYDPTTGTFQALAQGLAHARGLHAALALEDGRVLLAGGCETASLQAAFADPERPGSPLGCLNPGRAATTLEIVDPATGAGEVHELPFSLMAASLPAGPDALWLLGGLSAQGQPTRRAVFIQVTPTGVRIDAFDDALAAPRQAALAVAVSTPGSEPVEALLVGGSEPLSREDPGPFAEHLVLQAGALHSRVPRFVGETFGDGLPVTHAAGDGIGPGQALVTGGIYPSRFLSQDTPFIPSPLEVAGVADLRLDRLRMLDPARRLLTGRFLHACSAYPRQGRAWVTGGFVGRAAGQELYYAASRGVEQWDHAAERFSLRWRAGAPVELSAARAGHSATRLPDGSLLLVGGTDGSQIHASAELFSPFDTLLEDQGLPVP
jgi:hypothetical protein